MTSMMEIDIHRRRMIGWIVIVSLAITLALVSLDWAITYRRATEIGAIRRLFNMAREDSLGGWFAVTVTSLAALTAWLTWAVVRRGGRRGKPTGWLIVALFLTWMAVDDGAAVHERVGTAFEEVQADQMGSGGGGLARLTEAFPSYPWQIVLLPPFAVLGAFTLVFLWRVHPEARVRALTVAAFGCLAIAVGIDFLEGLDRDHPANVQAWLARRPLLAGLSAPDYETPLESVLHFGKVVEEAIEIAGLTLLWAVLLDHLAVTVSSVRFRIVG